LGYKQIKTIDSIVGEMTEMEKAIYPARQQDALNQAACVLAQAISFTEQVGLTAYWLRR
jgi:hypothetical protein